MSDRVCDPKASVEPATGTPAAGPRRFSLRPFRRDRRGVAAVEFGMLAMPFFLIVFAIIETGLIFLAELTLDQAVDRVARLVRTGEAQKAEMTEAQFKAAICDRVSFLMDCDKLKIDLSIYDTFSQIPKRSRSGTVDSTGFGVRMAGSERIAALQVYYSWPIYTDLMRQYLATSGDGTQLISAVAAFRTEPF